MLGVNLVTESDILRHSILSANIISFKAKVFFTIKEGHSNIVQSAPTSHDYAGYKSQLNQLST